MVNLSPRQENGKSLQIESMLVLAALSVAVLAFSGCGESPNDAGKRQAKQTSDEAARVTQTAGDLRPGTEIMATTIPWTPEKTVDRPALDKKLAVIQDAIKRDHEGKQGVWKKYLDQKSVGDDLKDASDSLAKLLAAKTEKNESIVGDANARNLLQAQLGATSYTQAQVIVNQTQEKLLDLATRASAITVLSERIASLGLQAKTLTATTATPADVATAQTTADSAKADAGTTAALVTRLENDIATKQAKAAEVYRKTDADMAAADQAKGRESIDAYKAAVEARKEAELLTKEVANLQPQLLQAKTEAAVAQIRLKETTETLAMLKKSADTSTGLNTDRTTRAGELMAQAKKLIEDPGTGLAVQVKAYNDEVAVVEAEIETTNKLSGKSVSSYKESINHLEAFKTEILTKNPAPKDGPEVDPQRIWARDGQPKTKAFLQIAQAAARQQTGRAQMIGWVEANLQMSVDTAVAKAYKGAGAEPAVAATTAPAADKKAATFSDEAKKEFDASILLLNTAAGNSEPAVKWLSASLRAVGYHGTYVLTGDEKAKEAGKNAAAEALSGNPALQLTGVNGL